MSAEQDRGEWSTEERFSSGGVEQNSAGQGRTIHYNRLALVGVVVYLMEFIFIIPFFREPPEAGMPASEIAAFYAANRTDILTYVAGVSAAILGVLLFATALRSVLRQVGGGSTAPILADFALACAVVAIAVETVGMVLEGIAANMATYGEDGLATVAAALHGAGFDVATMPWAVFVLAASLAMVLTAVLPRWIGWVGLVSAVGYGSGTVFLAYDPDSALGLVQVAGWLLMIVWMLATGIVLFRRAPSWR
jgi:hypothetical protein